MEKILMVLAALGIGVLMTAGVVGFLALYGDGGGDPLHRGERGDHHFSRVAQGPARRLRSRRGECLGPRLFVLPFPALGESLSP
jgi:hypothetical protein